MRSAFIQTQVLENNRSLMGATGQRSRCSVFSLYAIFVHVIILFRERAQEQWGQTLREIWFLRIVQANLFYRTPQQTESTDPSQELKQLDHFSLQNMQTKHTDHSLFKCTGIRWLERRAEWRGTSFDEMLRTTSILIRWHRKCGSGVQQGAPVLLQVLLWRVTSMTCIQFILF